MRRKINLVDLMMQMLLTLLFAELVFPPLTAVTNSYIVSLLCIGGWLVLSILKDKSFYLRCPLYVLIACIYVFLVILIPYLFGYPVIGNRYSAILLIPFGYVIYKYHQQHQSVHIVKWAITIAIILSVLTALITLAALIKDPYISRSIKSDGEYSEILASRGIGGYFFIYYTAIVAPILLQCVICKHDSTKILYGILYTLCGALVIKSNYTTALLMMVVSSSILIMFRVFQRSRYQILLATFFTTFCLVFFLFGESLLWEVIVMLPKRVASIFDKSSNATILEQLFDEFIRGRWPRMQQSVSAFFDAPLFGIVVSGDLGRKGMHLDGFGQHSHILDTFALYGVGIGILTIYLSFLPFRKKDRTSDTGFMLSVMLCAVMVYLFNNATNSIAFAISIIYPFVRDEICKVE